MSLYFFRISHGRYSGASEQGSEFESREAAWNEMTKVCANLLGGISRSLKQNAEWHMELLDESKKPVFRIRLVAESLGLDHPVALAGPASLWRSSLSFIEANHLAVLPALTPLAVIRRRDTRRCRLNIVRIHRIFTRCQLTVTWNRGAIARGRSRARSGRTTSRRRRGRVSYNAWHLQGLLDVVSQSPNQRPALCRLWRAHPVLRRPRRLRGVAVGRDSTRRSRP